MLRHQDPSLGTSGSSGRSEEATEAGGARRGAGRFDEGGERTGGLEGATPGGPADLLAEGPSQGPLPSGGPRGSANSEHSGRSREFQEAVGTHRRAGDERSVTSEGLATAGGHPRGEGFEGLQQRYGGAGSPDGPAADSQKLRGPGAKPPGGPVSPEGLGLVGKSTGHPDPLDSGLPGGPLSGEGAPLSGGGGGGGGGAGGGPGRSRGFARGPKASAAGGGGTWRGVDDASRWEPLLEVAWLDQSQTLARQSASFRLIRESVVETAPCGWRYDACRAPCPRSCSHPQGTPCHGLPRWVGWTAASSTARRSCSSTASHGAASSQKTASSYTQLCLGPQRQHHQQQRLHHQL
ncbi:uncharacterized protein LOC144955665 [Lampetra fluviatilis]